VVIEVHHALEDSGRATHPSIVGIHRMLEQSFLLADYTVPSLNTGYGWLMFASRLLHILGAIVLVGGLFYIWAVISPLPSGERPGDGSNSVDHYFGGRRATWAKWIGVASLILLATGLWNFISMVTANKLHFTYHMLGTLKIVLALVLMMFSALLAGRTATADSLRRKWRTWLTLTLLIGIITVAVGSVMRTYPRTPKLDTPPETTIIAP
jgi:uncharacterized membrane protein